MLPVLMKVHVMLAMQAESLSSQLSSCQQQLLGSQQQVAQQQQTIARMEQQMAVLGSRLEEAHAQLSDKEQQVRWSVCFLSCFATIATEGSLLTGLLSTYEPH